MHKVIIDEIIARAGNNFTDQEAISTIIEAMEQERTRSKAPLDKFIKAIKEKRKHQQ
jgi:hypothetical protein